MDDISRSLAELAELHTNGDLTDTEYSEAKRVVLDGRSTRASVGDVAKTESSSPAWRWERILDYKSRTRRSEWWATLGISWAVLVGAALLGALISSDNPMPFVAVGAAIFFFLYWGATANRLHDLGMHGWWAFALLVPLVGLWFFILIAFKEGEPKQNRWGFPVGYHSLSPTDSATLGSNLDEGGVSIRADKVPSDERSEASRGPNPDLEVARREKEHESEAVEQRRAEAERRRNVAEATAREEQRRAEAEERRKVAEAEERRKQALRQQAVADYWHAKGE